VQAHERKFGKQQLKAMPKPKPKAAKAKPSIYECERCRAFENADFETVQAHERKCGGGAASCVSSNAKPRLQKAQIAILVGRSVRKMAAMLSFLGLGNTNAHHRRSARVRSAASAGTLFRAAQLAPRAAEIALGALSHRWQSDGEEEEEEQGRWWRSSRRPQLMTRQGWRGTLRRLRSR